MKDSDFYVPDPLPPLLPVDFKLGPSIHSGEATFTALKKAVEEVTRAAPETCDVFIRAYDLTVWEIRFVEPHTLLFSGVTDDGHHACEVIHFSQLRARVVYQPKGGETRRLIGFCR